MSENEHGVVLTEGARGPQDGGYHAPRACIPPYCIMSIKYQRTGDAIPRTRLLRKGIILRDSPEVRERTEGRGEAEIIDLTGPDEAGMSVENADPEELSRPAEASGASPRAAAQDGTALGASSTAAPQEEKEGPGEAPDISVEEGGPGRIYWSDYGE